MTTSASLWQYCRDELDYDDDDTTDSESFEIKSRFTNNTNNAGINFNIIAVLLKHLSNFWRTSKIPLIRCEVSPDFIWSANSVIFDAYKARNFAITDTKLYVLIISLSTQINAKLIQQLK